MTVGVFLLGYRGQTLFQSFRTWGFVSLTAAAHSKQSALIAPRYHMCMYEKHFHSSFSIHVSYLQIEKQPYKYVTKFGPWSIVEVRNWSHLFYKLLKGVLQHLHLLWVSNHLPNKYQNHIAKGTNSQLWQILRKKKNESLSVWGYQVNLGPPLQRVQKLKSDQDRICHPSQSDNYFGSQSINWRQEAS